MHISEYFLTFVISKLNNKQLEPAATDKRRKIMKTFKNNNKTMRNEILLGMIAAYDAEVAGTDVLPIDHYTIDSELEVEEGVSLITFTGNYPDGCANTTACLLYEDEDEVFFLYDWQSGYPETRDEIGDYEWRTSDGHIPVMMNGLPRRLL